MRLFGIKKRKSADVLNISGMQLQQLIEAAVAIAREEIEDGCYTIGPEIMFEYRNKIHFAGVKYDKRKAHLMNGDIHFDELISLYVDKSSYRSVEELLDQACIDGVLLKTIERGLIVSSEYRELIK